MKTVLWLVILTLIGPVTIARAGENLDGNVSTKMRLQAVLDLRHALSKLEDLSKQVNIGLNSFPGVDEKNLNRWVKDNSPSSSFYVKVEYGTEVGISKSGAPIRMASIYVVNPKKTSGFLWWKKVKHLILREPAWTHFHEEKESFNDVDIEALTQLLQ